MTQLIHEFGGLTQYCFGFFLIYFVFNFTFQHWLALGIEFHNLF